MAKAVKYEDLKVIDVKSKAFDCGIEKPSGRRPALLSFKPLMELVKV